MTVSLKNGRRLTAQYVDFPSLNYFNSPSAAARVHLLSLSALAGVRPPLNVRNDRVKTRVALRRKHLTRFLPYPAYPLQSRRSRRSKATYDDRSSAAGSFRSRRVLVAYIFYARRVTPKITSHFGNRILYYTGHSRRRVF